MTDYIEIIGGAPLSGELKVSGAKNAALPLMLASLLTAEKVSFKNLPNLEDVGLTVKLIEHFGGQVSRSINEANVSVPKLIATEASYSLVKALRASFWVLGPLLARGRAARVALPGGDIIGARPVDMHLQALSKMGADIKVKHGVVFATAVDGLKAATIELRHTSVGATHQVIMAASLTPGTTVLKRAACEPEIVNLAQMINKMGGDVEGAGTATVVVRGQEELGGCSIDLIGDRIEAGTYLLCGAVTGGELSVTGVSPSHLGDFLDLLSDLGLDINTTESAVHLRSTGRLNPIHVATSPFPGLATDLQAPLMAALAFASGVSTIEENVFEGRFGHVSELCRMGAQIQVDEKMAIITGQKELSGAPVEGHDIRAAASLVVAGLGAKGITSINEPHHLRRGYDGMESKLRSVGAKIGLKVGDPENFLLAGC